MTKNLRSNGTVWAHIFVAPNGMSPNPSNASSSIKYDHEQIIYQVVLSGHAAFRCMIGRGCLGLRGRTVVRVR